MAAIELASTEGFTRSAADVSLRRLANYSLSPALKAAFEAKLKADPKFAADPAARLGWFYARTPYWDERYLLYPIGRELKQ